MRISRIIPGTPFTRALQWVVRAASRSVDDNPALEFVHVRPDGAGGIMLEATDRYIIHRAQVPHFLLSDDWAREVATKGSESLHLPRQAVAECAKSTVHFVAGTNRLTWWAAQDAQDNAPDYPSVAMGAAKVPLDGFFTEPENATRCSFDAGALRKLCTGKGARVIVMGDAGLLPSHLLCSTAEGGVIAVARLCPDDDADTLSALYESDTDYAGMKAEFVKRALMGVNGPTSAVIAMHKRGAGGASMWQASPPPDAPGLTRHTLVMGCRLGKATPAPAA